MSSVKDPKNLANNSADSLKEPEETQPSCEDSCSCVPRLALRCDGKVLISLTDLEGVDLSKRETWIGLVLTEAEASDIQERLNYDEAASPTVARLLALDKKTKAKKTKNDDDTNDE